MQNQTRPDDPKCSSASHFWTDMSHPCSYLWWLSAPGSNYRVLSSPVSSYLNLFPLCSAKDHCWRHLDKFFCIKISILPHLSLMSLDFSLTYLFALYLTCKSFSMKACTKWLNVNVRICPVCSQHQFNALNHNTGLNTSSCCHPAGWFKSLFNQTAAGECKKLSGQAGKLEQKIWPNHTHRHTHTEKMSTRALCTELEVTGEQRMLGVGSSQSEEDDLRYSSSWNDRLESATKPGFSHCAAMIFPQ